MNDKKTNVYVKMSTRTKLKELAAAKGMVMLRLIEMLVDREIERMNEGR